MEQRVNNKQTDYNEACQKQTLDKLESYTNQCLKQANRIQRACPKQTLDKLESYTNQCLKQANRIQ